MIFYRNVSAKFLKTKEFWLITKLCFYFNPFVPNAPLPLPRENIRKPYAFLIFQGVEKGCIGMKLSFSKLVIDKI